MDAMGLITVDKKVQNETEFQLEIPLGKKPFQHVIHHVDNGWLFPSISKRRQTPINGALKDALYSIGPSAVNRWRN